MLKKLFFFSNRGNIVKILLDYFLKEIIKLYTISIQFSIVLTLIYINFSH